MNVRYTNYHSSNRVEKKILGLTHSNIYGPIEILLKGAKYFATFINDRTRYYY